ncbi:hypothetical protein [Mycoavidus sp. SF9855]|nr:hypothetical protein [Mycoavidus sp. SF9855]UUM21947.1 hypothetical protein NQD60_02270 [Mycoavidus sp. SF9855]
MKKITRFCRDFFQQWPAWVSAFFWHVQYSKEGVYVLPYSLA